MLRQTMRKRLQAKLREVRPSCGDACTIPSRSREPTCGLSSPGHIRYYGVPMNGPALSALPLGGRVALVAGLRRRSQKHRLPWHRMQRLIPLAASPPHLPSLSSQRLGVVTQGGSRMR